MTDEKQKELLIEMRYYMAHGQIGDLIAVCDKAASEIERLAAEIEKLRKRPLTIAPRVMDNGEIR